jgi:hypothetical protein
MEQTVVRKAVVAARISKERFSSVTLLMGRRMRRMEESPSWWLRWSCESG